MQIQLRQHIVRESTPWGVIEKPLNQHIVLIKNEESNQFVQCGYVGDTTFLPLSGFPQSACDAVAAECSQQLGRVVFAGVSPPGLEELVQVLNANASQDEDE